MEKVGGKRLIVFPSFPLSTETPGDRRFFFLSQGDPLFMQIEWSGVQMVLGKCLEHPSIHISGTEATREMHHVERQCACARARVRVCVLDTLRYILHTLH